MEFAEALRTAHESIRQQAQANPVIQRQVDVSQSQILQLST